MNEKVNAKLNKKELKQNNIVKMPYLKLVTTISLILTILVGLIGATIGEFITVLTFLSLAIIFQFLQLLLKAKKNKAFGYRLYNIITSVVTVLGLLLNATYVYSESVYLYYVGNTLIKDVDPGSHITTILTAIIILSVVLSCIMYQYYISTADKEVAINNQETKNIISQPETALKAKLQEIKQMLDSGIINKQEYDIMLNSIIDAENKPKQTTLKDAKVEKINNLKEMFSAGMLTEEEYKTLLNELLTK